jgi:hypothetical protein
MHLKKHTSFEINECNKANIVGMKNIIILYKSALCDRLVNSVWGGAEYTFHSTTAQAVEVKGTIYI